MAMRSRDRHPFVTNGAARSTYLMREGEFVELKLGDNALALNRVNAIPPMPIFLQRRHLNRGFELIDALSGQQAVGLGEGG
jgi:hypothetical protein